MLLSIKKAILTLFVFFLFFMSCSKNNSFLSEVSGTLEPQLVKNLKSWLKKQSLNATQDQYIFIDSLINNSEWGEGRKINVSDNKSIIYVPIKNSIIGLGFYFDQNQNKIDSGAIIKIEWLSKRNGSSAIDAFQNYYFASKKLNTIQNKFSGIVSAYSVFNNYKHSLGFINSINKWEGFVAPKPKKEIVGNLEVNNLNKHDIGDCEIWGHFIRWSDGSITLEYTYLVCSECQTTSININTGGIYLKNECGGGGGTNNGDLIDIRNLIKNPCLRRIIENSINMYAVPYSKPTFIGTLSESFFSIFGNKSYWSNRDVIFAENSNISVPAKYKQGSGNFFPATDTIFINYDNIGSDPSQEYISSIIFHEMAHAVITYTNSSLLSQHQIMAFEYVNSISQTLMTIYPSMDLSSARSLALQGLGKDVYNSPFFQNIISSYGFNSIITSEKNWSNKALMHKEGSEGKKQCD